MSDARAGAAERGRRRLFRIPTIGAGLLDVGTSSAATFVCGLIAVRLLDVDVLGAYALAFRALVLAMTVPAFFVFQPREVQAAGVPEGEQLRFFAAGVRVGVPVAVLAALVSALWPVSFPGGVASESITALNVTMCFVAVLSPLQDFLRRMLHLSGRSWHAARVSLIHLAVVAIGWGIVTLRLVRLPGPWIPFGLLAIANAVSLIAGIALSGTKLTGGVPSSAEERGELLPSGGWLLVIGLIPNVTAVLVSAALAHMRGPDVLGYYEAARIVAQPILVLSLGLGAVLGPRAMRAAQARRQKEATHIAAQFRACLIALGAVYALAVGIPHRGNLLAWLVPEAFVIPWVVMCLIAAQVTLSLTLPSQNELLGAGRFRFLATTEAIGAGARVACVLLVRLVGVFALPIGLLVHALLRLGLHQFEKRRYYGSLPEPMSSPQETEMSSTAAWTGHQQEVHASLQDGIASDAFPIQQPSIGAPSPREAREGGAGSNSRAGAFRVLLLDEDWVQTLYLAHALDRSGCEVHILTSAPTPRSPYRTGRIRQLAAPLVRDPDYIAFVDSVINAGEFDCVLPLTETLMRRVWDASPSWADIVFPVTTDEQRSLLRHKRRLSEFLEPFGVRVPRIVTADSTEAVRSAVRALGTPIVVKGAEGEGGGTEVRFANDEAQALAAVEELERLTGTRPYLQQFIEGPTFLSGGLFLNGDPVRLYASEMLETFPPRVGPSIRHRTTHAPDLLRQTLAAMKALRWTGLAEGDFIRGPDDRYYFLEINPRPWGSIAAASRAGVDLFTPLHQMMRGETPAVNLDFDDAVDSVVFPQRVMTHFRRYGYTLRACSRVVTDHRSWRAVPWSRPRLVMHLLYWMGNRFRDKQARSRAALTMP